jgi:hypothetical protein
MAKDPETLAHLEWLGYVQPVGLVVSIPALLAAQAQVGKVSPVEHQKFLACLPKDKNDEIVPELPDIHKFVKSVLDWEASDLKEPPASLEVVLPEYNETLRPTFAVPEFQKPDAQAPGSSPAAGSSDYPWLMLVQSLPTNADFDAVHVGDDRHWQATPQARFERLLRETEVPIGLLFNHTHLRLVYAPRGETSGYADFGVADMASVSGRPIFAALHMLLSAPRLFSLPENQRLAAILADSRKYQNVVSTQLAEQVLAALFELLRGFQAADDAARGKLLHDVLVKDPNHVYSGLLTVLIRMVFILYAEDRGLLSTDSVYLNYYSVTGLFERLRADDGRFHDTMYQRYGAWAQLLTLFRLVYDGGGHAGFHIPGRKGYLFDPDRYPFLEGRTATSATANENERLITIPRVSDGVLFWVLSNLLILDGERLSYRTLDVEQIGSVYEAIMGFNLEVADGPSIAIKPTKSHGAPATINLEELLAAKSSDRSKWLSERTDQKVTGQAAEALKSAESIPDLLAALEKKIARAVTPNIVPKGAMIFQPSDERRRSGSHYTPRSLTEPIVRNTLEPILKRLGDKPTPQQLLDLKVCDPAMGSGAFLVQACRQLGDQLVKAWHIHNQVPKIPPDEDEILHARRLIAQRCLYGVDKNPMAVDLAKLSLWLATLAKDHPFTFLDHALRHGDSLVGLTRKQIADFHWLPAPQRIFGQQLIEYRINAATRARKEIIEAGDDVPFLLKQQKLAVADESLNLVRFAGNLVIAAFFAGDNDRKRKEKRDELLHQFSEYIRTHNMALRPTEVEQALRSGDKAIHPFHWEIEFPEVFGRENGGFDVMVGNPPFAGKNTLIASQPEGYPDWLKVIHKESHGNSDLVAHFFRRAFDLLRSDGCFGLVATKTIRQGDTRATGLRWICTHGGTIFAARRRYRWPGQAAVVISVVHIAKGPLPPPFELDDSRVSEITAYLFHHGGHENPSVLKTNEKKCFIGNYVLGLGFTFDDTAADGLTNRIKDMHELVAKDERNAKRIFAYINGADVNDDPTQAPYRYIINFGQMTEEEARKWPDLMKIVEEKVKPGRLAQNREARARYWWRFAETAPALYDAIQGLHRVLVRSLTSTNFSTFVFLPNGMVYDQTLIVFALSTFSGLAVLASRIHEGWAVFLGGSMKDDPRYNVEDCFETFPFPDQFETDSKLEAVGKEYYEFRAALMVKNNEGLTRTYNRFHDRDHDASEASREIVASIQKLRELHAALDRAVLDAYGWTDLKPRYEFLLDYEEDEDNQENGNAKKRKRPWHYRWPDEFRDEVLARLLELNKKRAEEERLSGEATAAVGKKRGKRTRRPAAADAGQSRLPGI